MLAVPRRCRRVSTDAVSKYTRGWPTRAGGSTGSSGSVSGSRNDATTYLPRWPKATVSAVVSLSGCVLNRILTTAARRRGFGVTSSAGTSARRQRPSRLAKASRQRRCRLTFARTHQTLAGAAGLHASRATLMRRVAGEETSGARRRASGAVMCCHVVTSGSDALSSRLAPHAAPPRMSPRSPGSAAISVRVMFALCACSGLDTTTRGKTCRRAATHEHLVRRRTSCCELLVVAWDRRECVLTLVGATFRLTGQRTSPTEARTRSCTLTPRS
jgi:hypothetical protein